MTPFQWNCPYCRHSQVVTDQTFERYFNSLEVGKTVHGYVGLTSIAIRCSNPRCNEIHLICSLDNSTYSGGRQISSGKILHKWTLLPDSMAKPQPEYIPAPIRDDYYEACLIRDRSPKASATLARRCLQGMIRDFCGISKPRLFDEIAELHRQLEEGTAPRGVEAETIEAIDAIRGVGNIGAHMERDISLIVEVDPGEAQALIELIEMLFNEWYVARHVRRERLAKVKAIAAEKKAGIRAGKAERVQQGLAESQDAPTDPGPV